MAHLFSKERHLIHLFASCFIAYALSFCLLFLFCCYCILISCAFLYFILLSHINSFQLVFQLYFPFFSFNSCPSRSLHFLQFSSFTTAVSPWGTFQFQYSSATSANGHHSKHTSSRLKGSRGKKGERKRILSPQVLIPFQKGGQRVSSQERRRKNAPGLMPAASVAV